MKNATNEEILADIRAMHRANGYVRHMDYLADGRFSIHMVERRFGSWKAACEAAGVPISTKTTCIVETVPTWCILCERTFARPAHDKSCRRCPKCARNKQWDKHVPEGWECVAC